MASIPEYYRHLSEERKRAAEGDVEPRPPIPPVGKPKLPSDRPGLPSRKEKPEPPPPALPFRAHQFSLHLYEGWEDRTLYFIMGPVTDGVQHNVVISLEPASDAMALADFADSQVRAIEDSLKGSRVLLKGLIELYNGMPAYRVIYKWHPNPGQRFYQQQVYVLHDGTAYKLAATFTKKTRKTVGPEVDRIMRSFEPTTPPS